MKTKVVEKVSKIKEAVRERVTKKTPVVIASEDGVKRPLRARVSNIKRKIPRYKITERTVRKVAAAAISAFIIGLETERKGRRKPRHQHNRH